VKVQQDMLGPGDLMAALGGDYSAWKGFVDAGVALLQTDYPDLLVPAVKHYNATGEFPTSGPARTGL